jgi:hypothetical protein
VQAGCCWPIRRPACAAATSVQQKNDSRARRWPAPRFAVDNFRALISIANDFKLEQAWQPQWDTC